MDVRNAVIEKLEEFKENYKPETVEINLKNISLNQYIDHTNLKPTATRAEIESLCKEALDYNF